MGEGPATYRGGRISKKRVRYYVAIGGAIVLGTGIAVGTTVTGASATPNTVNAVSVPATSAASSWYYKPGTATPIKHLVVLFDENESFDHYFGTYPYAANTDGSTFKAKPGTPTVNGLYSKITVSGPTGPLLTSNPNSYNPERLTPSEALTCDQNHGYTPEQEAFDGGKMDKFVQYTESASTCAAGTDEYFQPGLVMDYYDGNTVTALWNYAQNYAMSDNNYDTTFGPSTPGALNLISGSDGDGYAVSPTTGAVEADPGTVSALNSNGLGTIFGDLDPAYDDCSDTSHTATSPVGVMTGKNIGDLLNAKNVTWGWFQGGFAPTSTNAAGYAVCGSERENVGGNEVLQLHGQPQAPGAVVGSGHRPHGPGQPRVRPVRLLHHAEGRQHAVGQLPEGSRVRGRAPRLLRPAGRAGFPGEHDQPDRGIQVLGLDGDRHHLRRLRRLVRPPGLADRQRLRHRRGRGHLHLGRPEAG
jgi:phospholipase C